MIQNLWDTEKAVQRGKFMALESYFKKTRKNSNKQSISHLKVIEKEQTKPKVRRNKEIIKIRTEINKIEPKE